MPKLSEVRRGVLEGILALVLLLVPGLIFGAYWFRVPEWKQPALAVAYGLLILGLGPSVYRLFGYKAARKRRSGRMAESTDAEPTMAIDRQLVEKALALCQQFDSWHSIREPVAEIQELLRRALEEQDDPG